MPVNAMTGGNDENDENAENVANDMIVVWDENYLMMDAMCLAVTAVIVVIVEVVVTVEVVENETLLIQDFLHFYLIKMVYFLYLWLNY